MKNKLHLFITFLFIVLISNFATAQFGIGDRKEIASMKERKMIVLLQPENPDVIKKLEKKGHADLIPVYRKMLDKLNNNLKEAVSTGWKYHSEVIYKTVDEIEAIRKTKTKDYAVIMIFQQHNDVFTSTITPYLDWNYKSVVKGDYDADDKSYYSLSSYIRLVNIEDVKLRKLPIAMHGLSNVFPNKADLIAGLYGITYYIDSRVEEKKFGDMKKEMATNAAGLKTKILVIRESDLSSKLPKASFKSLYPYKYVVVNDSVFDSEIINHTAGKAFILTVPSISSNSIVYTQSVYDCETGKVLGMIMPSMGNLIAKSYLSNYTGLIISSGRGRIDDKIVKKLVELIKGS